MTSRSVNLNPNELDEFENQNAGQIYPPDQQCQIMYGDAFNLFRVRAVIAGAHFPRSTHGVAHRLESGGYNNVLAFCFLKTDSNN